LNSNSSLDNPLLKAVFLDRDGVFIKRRLKVSTLPRWQQVQFLPGALEAISTLYRAGFTIFIVTNQRGMALGKNPSG
jgi:histidinol phosphatase-like enzyme